MISAERRLLIKHPWGVLSCAKAGEHLKYAGPAGGPALDVSGPFFFTHLDPLRLPDSGSVYVHLNHSEWLLTLLQRRCSLWQQGSSSSIDPLMVLVVSVCIVCSGSKPGTFWSVFDSFRMFEQSFCSCPELQDRRILNVFNGPLAGNCKAVPLYIYIVKTASLCAICRYWKRNKGPHLIHICFEVWLITS